MDPRRMQRFTSALLALAYGLLAASLLGWALLTVSKFQQTTRAEEDAVAAHEGNRAEIERLRAAEERSAVEARSYLMTQFAPLLEEREAARRRYLQIFAVLRARLDAEGRMVLSQVGAAEQDLDAVFHRAAAVLERGGQPARGLGGAFVASQQEAHKKLDAALTLLGNREEVRIAAAREAALERAGRALQEVVWIAAVALLLATSLAFFLARAVREVRKNQEGLAARNQDLDAFAGRVAHDLRGVLTGLPLLAASLKRLPEGTATPDPAALAARVEKLSRNASKIIDGLLAFARAGGAPDPQAVTSAASVATDAIDDLLPLAQSGGVAVDAELEDAHARCAGPLLHVAAVNLISNAIKFSAGNPARRVRVRTRREGARCLFEVEDSGPGIAPEALPRIFDPFYRAPGAKADGCGIGLATVRRIADAHGGSVEVSSVPGRGTTARLWLPAVEPQLAAAPPPPPDATMATRAL